MKNKLIILCTLVFLITIVNVPILLLNKKKEILPEVKLKEIEKNKTFAIMVPDINGNGYIPYDGNEWPTEANDYFYSHSECVDNKGEKIENAIEYNQKENTALLDTNQTVYCTLYFDKYPYMYVPTHNVSYGESTILAPVYISTRVKKVEFVNYIKDDLKSNEENTNWWDLSDIEQGTPKGSVIAWIEPIPDDQSYDTLYIGSKTKIRATSLAYLFQASEFGEDLYGTMNIESINFNDKIDTSKTTDLFSTFNNQTKLSSIKGLENWDISKVINARELFYKCKNLSDINFLSKWNVSNIENMQDLFGFCSKITNINVLSNWNVSNVKNMRGMFRNLSELKDISPLSKWNVSKVNDMFYLFAECTNLQKVDLSEWSVSQVNNMSCLFASCTNLINVDLSKWNTSNVGDISHMFQNCTSLRTIDMSNATFTQITDVTNYQDMFLNVPDEAKIIVKNEEQKNWIQTKPTFKGTIETLKTLI